MCGCAGCPSTFKGSRATGGSGGECSREDRTWARGSCAENDPLLPTAIVATCEVSPEEERRDGHKEEGRAGRECQIWGTWTHRSKGEKQKASGVVRVSQCWVGVPPATCQVIYCCIAALETA